MSINGQVKKSYVGLLTTVFRSVN